MANLLSGGDGDDILNARAGDDRIEGGAGIDQILGGPGSDILDGGGERDILTGGSGSDVFFYAFTASSTPAAAGRDIIQDFSSAEGDVIWLASIDADATTAGDDAFAYLGAAPFSGTAGELRAEFLPAFGLTLVQMDVDGDASADMSIQLTGNVPLSATDFLL